MYPEIFSLNTFTLLANVEVGKHLYWNLAGFLVHGQVLVVGWFVFLILFIFLMVGKTLWNHVLSLYQTLLKVN